MAYVRSAIQFSTATGTSIDLSTVEEMPEYEIGDYCFLITNKRRAASVSTSGWTQVYNNTSGEPNSSMYYKKLTTSGEVLPTVTDSTSFVGWQIAVLIIADADPTNPIDTHSVSTQVASQVNWPIVTTTTDNCLLIYNFCMDTTGSTNHSYDTSKARFAYRVGGRTSYGIGLANLETAGNNPTIPMYFGSSSNSVFATVAIKNASGGAFESYPSAVSQRIVRNALIDNATLTFQNWGDVVGATYKGFTASTTSVTANSGASSNGESNYNFLQTALLNTWQGGVLVLPSAVDISNRLVSFEYVSTSIFSLSTVYPLEVVVADSAGNWRTVRVQRRPTDNVINNAFIDFENGTFEDESGTVDFTDIVKIGIARLTVSSSGSLNISIGNLFFHEKGDNILIGGSSSIPVDAVAIKNNFSIGAMPANHISRQGLGQVLVPYSLQIGDGTNTTITNFSGVSFETPRNFSTLQRIFDFNYGANGGYAGLIIKSSANDVIRLSDSIVGSSVTGFFEIDATAVTPATFETAGLQLRNMVVTWKSTFAATGIRFIECDDIDLKAAAITDCAFINQKAGSTTTISDGSVITGCEFLTETASNYALTIAAAGDFELEDTTFTGYTTDINVTATTGTVNITLASGQQIPTYTSAGATVNILAAGVDVTVTATNASGTPIENARVYLYASTTTSDYTAGDVILTGLTDASGVITTSLTLGVNQPVLGWVRKSTGSPLYKEGLLSGTISSTNGFNQTAILIVDE